MKNIILLALFLCAIKVHAEELNYSATYQKCIASANGEHPSMMNCLDQERDRIDTKIQATLSSSKYNGFQLEILKEIKKTNNLWAQYIEHSCSIYIHLGGQRAELLQGSCVVDATMQRLKYIQDLLAAASI
ncbi:hypothetical protein D3C85_927860 [compost metagenome]